MIRDKQTQRHDKKTKTPTTKRIFCVYTHLMNRCLPKVSILKIAMIIDQVPIIFYFLYTDQSDQSKGIDDGNVMKQKRDPLVLISLESRQNGIELSDSVMIIFVMTIAEVLQLNLPLL